MTRIEFGPFQLDPVAQRLLRDGAEVEVQPLVLQLLEYGARRPGELLDKGTLLQLLWPGVHVTEHSLTQAVHKLRSHLGPHAEWWRTVPRKGFRFDAPVRDLEPGPAAGRDSFHGRRYELTILDAAWDDGERFVVLAGAGGAGKTRLALEHIATTGSRWPWFANAELASVNTAAGFVSAVAGALGIALSERGGPEASVKQVGAALAHRGQGLVLLDNLEQLQPDVEPWIDAWRAAAPEARWLGTTRTLPRTDDVRVVEVAPLPAVDGRALFEARARGAGAVIDGGDEVDALVADLGGSPLAIELAAARAPLLDPAALRRRLHAGVLTGGAGHERHRSVEAAIRWSWDLLDPIEQIVLSRCALFAGGFTVDLADAVVGELPDGASVLDVLQALRAHSLLERLAVQARPVAGRLRMAPLVRAFARARLAEGDPARRRFVEVMALRAQDAAALGEHWDFAASRALEPDVVNWFEAVKTADDPALEIAIIGPVGRWLRLAGRPMEALDLWRRLPQGPAEDLPPDVLLARAEGDVYGAAGRPGQLEAVLRAGEAAVAAGDFGLAHFLCRVAGTSLYQLGRAEECRQAHVRGLEAARRGSINPAEHHLGEGRALLLLGRTAEAEETVRKGLAACKPGHDARIRTSLLDLLGYLAGADGRFDEAVSLFEQSLGAMDADDLPTFRLATLSNWSSALQEAGRFEEALRGQDECIALGRRTGFVQYQVQVLINRALTRLHLGDLAGAEQDLLDGWSLHGPNQGQHAIFLALNGVTLEALRGRWERAVAQADDCLGRLGGTGLRPVAFDAHLWATLADTALGRIEAARGRLAAMDAIGTEGLPRVFEACVAQARAFLDLRAADSDDAIRRARAALDEIDASAPVAALVRRVIARALGERGVPGTG